MYIFFLFQNRTCEGNKFKCAKGRCIIKEWVCDGISNCVGDANDEDIEMCKVQILYLTVLTNVLPIFSFFSRS